MRVGVGHLIAAVAMMIVVGSCGSDEAEIRSDAVSGVDLDDVPVSAPLVLCEEFPTVPTFTIGGADHLDAGGWSVEGEVGSLDIDDSRLELTLGEGSRAVDLAIENSGIAEIDLSVGRTVMVEYRHSQGFEGDARAIRLSDQDGVVMLVEDGDYGNALPQDSLAPFAVGQTDIGCRNRSNTPGSLNNFALTIETAKAAVVLMPGASSIITVDGNDYAARNLRSISRHSDVQWTDAPYSYTSFSIVRLPT